MHEVLVNRLGGLSLPWKSVVRITDRPDMTLDVYHGRKKQQQQQQVEACGIVEVLSFCPFTLIFLWRLLVTKILKFQFSMQSNVLSYCFERINLLIIRYQTQQRSRVK